MKKVTFTVLAVLVVLFGGFLFLSPRLIETTTDQSSETALLKEQLLELSDLTTLKYEYSNVIVSRTNKSVSLMGMTDIAFAEAIRLIEYSGYLKAGTDLSQLQVSTDEESGLVSVKVPHSQILDNVVDTENTTVEDVKGNIFSDYSTQIVFDEINANKKQLEEDKISQGFLEEADEQVESVLTSFFNSSGYNEVDIKFY